MRARACAVCGASALLLCAPLALPKEPMLTVGVGTLGQVGWAGLGAPEPETVQLPRSGDVVRMPGLSGPAAGLGLAAELRVFGWVGLEVDALYTHEAVSGKTQHAGPVTLSVAQNSLRIPVLIKGTLPRLSVAPFVVAGPTFTLQGLSDAESEPAERLRTVANAGEPVSWTFGAGVEWRPRPGGVDLRVPFGARVRLNPAVASALEDRVIPLPTDALVLDSTLSYEIGLTLGAGVFF